MSSELQAWAIGPDRIEIVVGYNEQSAIEFYENETGVTKDEWREINPFPMENKFPFECEDGTGYLLKSVREVVSDVKKFPVIAGYSE